MRGEMTILSALMIAVSLVDPVTAGEKSFPSVEGNVFFATPSGNLWCAYTPPGGGAASYPSPNGSAQLTCHRLAPRFAVVVLGERGPASRVDPEGDWPHHDGLPVLGYGDTWRAGPFDCTSRRKGLTCRSTGGGHFTLSRSAVAVD